MYILRIDAEVGVSYITDPFHTDKSQRDMTKHTEVHVVKHQHGASHQSIRQMQ